MKIHIHEQDIELKADIITESHMDNEPATAPAAVPESTSGGVETAQVEATDTSSTPTDQGVQAPVEATEPVVGDQVNG